MCCNYRLYKKFVYLICFTFVFPSAILFSGGFFMFIFGLLLFVRWVLFPALVIFFLVLGIRYFLKKK